MKELQEKLIACDNVDDLKNIAKSYVKLHLKYQETLASLNFNNL